MLETGELDLALGAIVDEAPGIRRIDLCTEGFACAVRREHPTIRGKLSLDDYVGTSHLLITLGDSGRPTWVDEALAARGRRRHVALRVRHFMAAPLVAARTDLLMTGPSMLIKYFAALVPLQVLEPPIPLPTYPEEAYWHERFDSDPAHRWLREIVRRAAGPLGLGGIETPRDADRRVRDNGDEIHRSLLPTHLLADESVAVDRPIPASNRHRGLPGLPFAAVS